MRHSRFCYCYSIVFTVVVSDPLWELLAGWLNALQGSQRSGGRSPQPQQHPHAQVTTLQVRAAHVHG
jgi:hypothetical protein